MGENKSSGMMREIGCRAKREDITHTRTHTIAGENRLCITIHIVNYGMYSDVTNRCYICAELALRSFYFFLLCESITSQKSGKRKEKPK